MSNTAIVKFPAKELDLTAMEWIQKRNQMYDRDNIAQNYSAICKRKHLNKFKETVMYLVSGASVVLSIMALYFVMF